jgi:hypothetical protein
MKNERIIVSRDQDLVTYTIERIYLNADRETKRNHRHDMHAVVTDGIVRWDSNGQVPPKDVVEEMLAGQAITTNEYLASGRARDTETAKFLDAYRTRMANHVPDAEELYEMRAAFGEGAEVVNIITGQRTTV